MPKLTTDFNVSPYYDDFSEDKKFFKILYRPGYSVQAREMSQMQTLLQNQIERLGDFNFTDGDRVSGAEISLNTKVNSLKLQTNYASVQITASNFKDRIIQGNTSGARATVVEAESFTQTTLNTLMINYLDEKVFVDDEIIQTIDTGTTYFANVAGETEGLTGVTTLVSSVSSGEGSVVTIDEGVFYIGGYFVYTSPQTLILEKYSSTPTYRVGLSITETVISSVDDTSLLDNALGTPNYTAPGANRYKIDLVLSRKNIFEAGVPVVSSGMTFTEAVNTVTVTTSTDHNLANGDFVIVSGASQSEYNGKFPIANTTSGTTFTYFASGKPVTPATGSPIYTKAVTNPLEARSDVDFIELLRVENGVKTKEIINPLYGAIGDVLARRTYDQSGDFTVKPFSIAFETHKITGIATTRTTANACTTFTGQGTGFVSQLNTGDSIFLSGNTSKTATIDSITDNLTLTLTSGTALGDGSNNQKIGVDSKVTAALSPGKAYVKGYEYESVTTSFIDINKGRDTRTVAGESQGTDFGPYLTVTDLHQKVGFDVGVDTGAMGSGTGAAGMDLIDLHMVKWPATDETNSGTAIAQATGNIEFIGIHTSSAATIANTKIGTARIRQLDFKQGRDSSITTKYGSSGTNTHHNIFSTIYDAHLFDFRFKTVTGTVGSATSNVTAIQLKTSGADSFPTINCLYGCSVTVNTSFQGITTSDTRKVLSWSGSSTASADYVDRDSNGTAESSTYTAVLDSALSQPTIAASTYSVDFGVKDIRSGVKISSTTINDAFNVDPSGKVGGADTGDTILYKNNDEERSLIFPLQNPVVANLNPTGTSTTTYRFKRTFTATLTSGQVGTISAPSGEVFYPGTNKTLSASECDANFIISCTSGTHDGHVIEFSNTSGSGMVGPGSGSDTRSLVLSSDGATLTINGDSSTTGAKSFASQSVKVIATMQRSNATATGSQSQIAKKVLVTGNTTHAVVDHNSANKDQSGAGQIVFGTGLDINPGANNSLDIADIKKLVAIVDSMSLTANVTTAHVTAAISDSANQHNITSRFEFNDGQKDNYYDYGKITLKPGETKPTGQVMAIVDYYTHSGVGPITVDSYIYSGAGNTSYTEIPSFTSPVSGNKFQLRDVIDFRPKRIGIETANTGESGTPSHTNDITTTANVFQGKVLPDFDYTFDTDYAHYIPRKDKIALTRDRNFKVIQGVSDVNPVLPPDDDDSLTLYTAEVPAYTFNPSDIKTRYIDNKRFTMRDIGSLERRIETLEYYVSLSLLEKEADGLTITDVNSNDRFKNGILVDPFAGHNIGDVFNADYNSSVDYENKELRPPFKSDLTSLKYDSNTQNSTLVNNGGVITLPFTTSPFIIQPQTGNLTGKNLQKTLKINPFSIQNYIGNVDLDPPTDTWYDSSSRAVVVTSLEGQYDNWPNVETANAHGTHWNDWEEIWSGVQINNDVREGIRDTGDIATNDRKAKTTGQTKTLTGLKNAKIPEKILKTVGNRVVNISVVPKMREQTISFVSKGLKPNKNVYAFFEDSPVTDKVKQATLIGLSNVSTSNIFRTTSSNYETIEIQGSLGNAGNTAKIVYMGDRTSTNSCSIMIIDESQESAFSVGSIIEGIDTKANGTISSVTNYSLGDGQILVNNEGVSAGQFNIPAGTFNTGEQLFRVSDDSDNILASTTSVAEKMFHNKGVMDSNREEGIISVRPLIKRRDDITQSTIVKSYAQPRRNESSKYLSPLAQVFIVSEDNYPSGIFLDSIELFFNTKDSSSGSKNPVMLQIRPMVDGAPSPSTIVPGSEVTLTPGRVTANTSTPTANTLGGYPATSLGNSFTANKSGLDQGSKTIFKFDFPVFLNPGEYAFTLQSNNSEYSVYSFELGAKHTGTDRKITKQPYIGKLFKPSNADKIEGSDIEGLMFVLNRSSFSSETGYARFDNFHTSSGNATSDSTIDSMKVLADVIEFANTTNEFKYRSTASGATLKSTATSFVVNKNIDLKTQQKITYTSDTSNVQYQNSFQLNVYFTSANNIISPVIDGTRTGVITIENDLNNAGLKNTSILVTNIGAGLLQSQIGGDSGTYASPNAIDGNTSIFTVSAPDMGSNTATIAANVAADGKLNEVVVVNPGAGYLTTPSITLASITNSTNPVVKIIGEGANGTNMLTANSEHSRGGNITAKYITRRVTLEEGFDARDLRVYLNAYKPRGSDIHVYYKVIANDDPENFDDKPYILMEQDTSAGLFSMNEKDFKQYVFKTKDEKISYKSDTATFSTFRTFVAKIVFTRNEDSQTTFIGIPKVSDLKVIALDSVGNP